MTLNEPYLVDRRFIEQNEIYLFYYDESDESNSESLEPLKK
jgi:hypothetical protein